MKFTTIRLEQCCDCITDGDHLPPPKADKGIPFITISNVDAYNQIDFSNSMYVPEQYYDALKETRKARKNDILYSVVGSFGIPILVKENKKFCFQRHIALLRPKETVDSRFLYYVLKSASFYAQADTVALGAAQRTISLSSLRSMTIQMPEFDVQRRIADILSAYDDLIENNRKQIKLLEEAAQRLYKEWFIDLRFPGWESTPVVDGLPEGWKKEAAISFFDITIGKTPPRAEPQWFSKKQSDVKWLSISDMGKSSVYALNTSEFLTDEAILKFNMKIVPVGTILLSFKLTVGRVSIVADKLCTNEAIAHFRADNKNKVEYTYQYLKNFDYSTLGSTSAISQAVNSKIIKAMPFILPSGDTIEKYHERVTPLFGKIYTLQQQVEMLLNARDALLPKLMSGEIEV